MDMSARCYACRHRRRDVQGMMTPRAVARLASRVASGDGIVLAWANPPLRQRPPRVFRKKSGMSLNMFVVL
jgi:hypothetical protein